MCFQGFATCSCGHIRLLENACELATDIPFYIKVACPNYNFRSIKTSRACGEKGFYCRETGIGQFLEQVHNIIEQTQVQIEKLDAQSAKVDVQAAKFTKAAEDSGVSQAACRLHSAYRSIFGTLQDLERRRDQATEQHMAAKNVIQHAVKYYHVRAAHARKSDASEPPQFTLPENLRSKLPEELQTKLDTLAMHNHVSTSANTAKIIDISHEKGDQGLEISGHCLGTDNIYVTPKKPGNPQGERETPDVIGSQDESTLAQNAHFGALVSEFKHDGQTKWSVEKDGVSGRMNKIGLKGDITKKSSLINEKSSIRRSARVRDKKVSYAESEVSTIHSREPSPEKSDGDNFSPPKSDVSTSPESDVVGRRTKVPEQKRRPNVTGDSKFNRSNATLSSLINDWNRRAGVALNNFPNARQQMIGNKSFAHHRLGQAVTGLPTTTRPSSNITPSSPSDVLASAHDTISRTKPVAHTPCGGQPSPHLGLPSQKPYDGSSRRSMGRQYVSDNDNCPSGTAGSVSVSPYQVRMTFNDQMVRDSPNAPYQSGQFQTSPVPQNVHSLGIVDTPAFDNLRAQALVQPQSDSDHDAGMPLERNDSALGTTAHSGPARGMNKSSIGSDYDRLRRSFGATIDLTPPASVDLTSTSTDPKKRRLPGSSPMPPNKHKRLSLPGEDAAGVYRQPVMSYPEKLSSYDSNSGKNENLEPPAGPEEERQVTAAPILAPTAVMYVPSQSIEVSESTNSAMPGGSGVRPNNGTGAAGGIDNQFSDIDWTLLNDDIFESHQMATHDNFG